MKTLGEDASSPTTKCTVYDLARSWPEKFTLNLVQPIRSLILHESGDTTSNKLKSSRLTHFSYAGFHFNLENNANRQLLNCKEVILVEDVNTQDKIKSINSLFSTSGPLEMEHRKRFKQYLNKLCIVNEHKRRMIEPGVIMGDGALNTGLLPEKITPKICTNVPSLELDKTIPQHLSSPFQRSRSFRNKLYSSKALVDGPDTGKCLPLKDVTLAQSYMNCQRKCDKTAVSFLIQLIQKFQKACRRYLSMIGIPSADRKAKVDVSTLQAEGLSIPSACVLVDNKVMVCDLLLYLPLCEIIERNGISGFGSDLDLQQKGTNSKVCIQNILVPGYNETLSQVLEKCLIPKTHKINDNFAKTAENCQGPNISLSDTSVADLTKLIKVIQSRLRQTKSKLNSLADAANWISSERQSRFTSRRSVFGQSISPVNVWGSTTSKLSEKQHTLRDSNDIDGSHRAPGMYDPNLVLVSPSSHPNAVDFKRSKLEPRQPHPPSVVRKLKEDDDRNIGNLTSNDVTCSRGSRCVKNATKPSPYRSVAEVTRDENKPVGDPLIRTAAVSLQAVSVPERSHISSKKSSPFFLSSSKSIPSDITNCVNNNNTIKNPDLLSQRCPSSRPMTTPLMSFSPKMPSARIDCASFARWPAQTAHETASRSPGPIYDVSPSSARAPSRCLSPLCSARASKCGRTGGNIGTELRPNASFVSKTPQHSSAVGQLNVTSLQRVDGDTGNGDSTLQELDVLRAFNFTRPATASGVDMRSGGKMRSEPGRVQADRLAETEGGFLFVNLDGFSKKRGLLSARECEREKRRQERLDVYSQAEADKERWVHFGVDAALKDQTVINELEGFSNLPRMLSSSCSIRQNTNLKLKFLLEN